MKIAVVGKGGVGKTLIAGTLAYLLHNKGFKTIALDGDPNANLAYTLGISRETAEAILPIAENSELIEEKTGVSPDSYGTVFRLNFTVDDIIERFAVKTPLGVSLLVMGVVRVAVEGCMCPANHLVRMILRHLLVRGNEVIITDMEAGTEHFGRGTAEYVDAMLIIVEPTAKALETARRIISLANQMEVGKILLLGNKVQNEREEELIKNFSIRDKIQLLGLVQFDQSIREADLTGRSPLLINPPPHAIQDIGAICENLLLIIDNKE